jgi:hypothetical protein
LGICCSTLYPGTVKSRMSSTVRLRSYYQQKKHAC